MTDYDVVVIGGGMAGISTAFHLSSCEKFKGSVAVLEARPRFGGRIHGCELSSAYVELGANWIHGIMGNPICDIAFSHKLVDPLGAETNPSTDSVQSKRYFVCGLTSNGERVPINVIEEVYTAYFWFTKQCDSYHSSGDKEMSVFEAYENSLGKHLIADIESFLKTKVKDNVSLKRSIFHNLLQRESCISGSHSVEDVSLRDFGSYEELPGGNLVISGGYSQLLSVLLSTTENNFEKKNRDKSNNVRYDTFLDHEVTKINWGSKADKTVEVHCANGKVFKCSHVVCTLPLGVLKSEAETIFEPSLPRYKLDCINRLGFNVVDKIFLEFRHKLIPEFIDPMVNEMLLFWPEEGEKANDPIKLKEDSPKQWWKTIYSFSRVSDRCLMGWLSGDDAKFVEQLDSEEVGRIITEKVLRPFLNKPNFPVPENVVITKWYTDPFTRGSYTYIHRHCSIRDIEMLAQPIYSDPGQEKVFISVDIHDFMNYIYLVLLAGTRVCWRIVSQLFLFDNSRRLFDWKESVVISYRLGVASHSNSNQKEVENFII